jgi:hypothetical protein
VARPGLLDSLVQRVRTTLGNPAPNAPGVPGQPPEGGPKVNERPSPGLLSRVKDRVKSFFGNQEQREDGTDTASQLPMGKPDLATANLMVRQAGKQAVLLAVKYNGQWRHMEPYSFRRRSAGGEPLFYAFCRLHDEIHSIYLSRVEGLMVTDIPFSPRWPIELG